MWGKCKCSLKHYFLINLSMIKRIEIKTKSWTVPNWLPTEVRNSWMITGLTSTSKTNLASPTCRPSHIHTHTHTHSIWEWRLDRSRGQSQQFHFWVLLKASRGQWCYKCWGIWNQWLGYKTSFPSSWPQLPLDYMVTRSLPTLPPTSVIQPLHFYCCNYTVLSPVSTRLYTQECRDLLCPTV
jgi:hypothetical protein